MRPYLVLFSLLPAALLNAQAPVIQTIAGSFMPGFSGDGGPATQAAFYSPRDVMADSQGNVYVLDVNNYRIRKISPTGIVSTIAGNGVRGTAGDGGPALAASVGFMNGLAYDELGHLCFGDTDAHKLRCVNLNNGTINGYGTGNGFTGGDGGMVTAASFNWISGIAMVQRAIPPAITTDIYVVDFIDNVLRKIDGATGIVTNLIPAGTLSFPRGLTYRNNALYIADSGNSVIRRYDLSTNTLTTVAGNGVPYYAGDNYPALQGQLMSPGHVTFDSVGNMFITDRGNMRIRRVDAASNVITTFAGDGYSGIGNDNVAAPASEFSGIEGVAYNPVANTIVIADGANRLRSVPARPQPVVSMNASPQPGAAGEPIHLAASIVGVNAGTVTWYDTLTAIATAPVSNGVATADWTNAFQGSHTLRAVFSGTDTLSAGVSPIQTLDVTGARTATTTTLTFNPASPVVGQTVTLTAAISPATVTGTVTFFQGSTPMTQFPTPVSNGVATVTFAATAAGPYTLTAAYQGDSQYLPSSALNVPLTVNKTATATVLVSSVNPSAAGQSVTFTASVAPAAATGTVSFLVGTALLGTATLTGGSASISTAALPAGVTTITAQYNGDAAYLASVSAPLSQTVKYSTTTSLTSNAGSGVAFGQAVTFTAQVSPAFITGSVEFSNNGTVIGTATIASGAAVLTTSVLPGGLASVTARYVGSATAQPSISSPVNFTVFAVPSATSLTITPTTALAGQQVTMRATVTPSAGANSGLVQFREGTTTLFTAPVVSGVATFNTTALSRGNHQIRAYFLGNANLNPSNSTQVLVRIN